MSDIHKKLLGKANEFKAMEQFTNIYILPDLTRMQQLGDKEIRDQIKKVGIEGWVTASLEKLIEIVYKQTRSAVNSFLMS